MKIGDRDAPPNTNRGIRSVTEPLRAAFLELKEWWQALVIILCILMFCFGFMSISDSSIGDDRNDNLDEGAGRPGRE